jgi:hypothetical protein
MAVMHQSAGHEYWEGRGLVLLWAAMLAGPLAWTIDQGLGYASVKPSCAAGTVWPLLLYTAVALGIVTAGGWAAWWCLHQLRHANEDGGLVVDRSYFMAVVALGFNALIGLLIGAAAIPLFVLSPCE